MEDVNVLKSYSGTFHSRLFTKKFGKSVQEFRKDGIDAVFLGCTKIFRAWVPKIYWAFWADYKG